MKKLNKNPKPKKKNPDDYFIYSLLSSLVNVRVVLTINEKFLTTGLIKELKSHLTFELIENLDFSDEFNLEFDSLPTEFYNENTAMEILYNERKNHSEKIIYSFNAKDVDMKNSGRSIDQTKMSLDWAGIYHKARNLNAIDPNYAIKNNIFNKIVQGKIIIINLKKDADVKIKKIVLD